MTKPGYTHIAVLMDRSGSMQVIRDVTEQGLRTFVADQCEVAGSTATMELFEFDHEFAAVYPPTPVTEVPNYQLCPRGRTALLDAMADAIMRVGEWLHGLPEPARPDKVIFVIVTDGRENESYMVTRDEVFAMVTKQQTMYGWEFVFLAANQDAIAEAAKLGIEQRSATTYNADTVLETYSAMSASVVGTRTLGAPITLPDEI